jgi:hypothetical protein
MVADSEGMVADSGGTGTDSEGTVTVLKVVAGVSGGGSMVEVMMAGHISTDPIMMDRIMMTFHIMVTVPRMDSPSASAGMVGGDTAEIGTVGAGDNYA